MIWFLTHFVYTKSFYTCCQKCEILHGKNKGVASSRDVPKHTNIIILVQICVYGTVMLFLWIVGVIPIVATMVK